MPAMPPPMMSVAGLDLGASRLQRPHPARAPDRRAHDGDGLGRGLRAILGHPRALLADVGHQHEEGIETGLGAGPAEGGLVHARRARRHHHAVQPELGDVLLDLLLPGIRAHELVLARNHHAGFARHLLGQLFDVHRAGDVGATVTDVNPDCSLAVFAYRFAHRPPPVAWGAGELCSPRTIAGGFRGGAAFQGPHVNRAREKFA